MSTMAASHVVQTGVQTPFEAIEAMEQAAARRIEEEETKLQKEYDDACERAQSHRQRNEHVIAEKARESLRAAKGAAGEIVMTYEREAQEEGNALEKHAMQRREPILEKLKASFLRLV